MPRYRAAGPPYLAPAVPRLSVNRASIDKTWLTWQPWKRLD
jgi:hypothetical protein